MSILREKQEQKSKLGYQVDANDPVCLLRKPDLSWVWAGLYGRQKLDATYKEVKGGNGCKQGCL